MPAMENFADFGLVGVALPRCTTPSGRMAGCAIDRRPRKRLRPLAGADHYTYLKKLSARIPTLTFKTSLTIIPAKKKRI